MNKIIISWLFCTFLLGCSKAQPKKFETEALQKTLTTTSNTTLSFADVIAKNRGKVTVIEVWASWCSDCVKAMPKVKEMQAKFPHVNYVFISMDKTFDAWQKGIQKHQLQGEHYWSPDGMKGEFGKAIDLDWIPRYILIDREGTVVTYKAIETDFEAIFTTLNTLEK